MKVRRDNPLLLAALGFAVTAAGLTAVRAEARAMPAVSAAPRDGG